MGAISNSPGLTSITIPNLPRGGDDDSGKRRKQDNAAKSDTAEQRDDAEQHNAGDSFGVVYVNDVARHAMLEEENPQFPVGSIIIREKLARSDDTRPQLVIALVKRERGFNPQANDWEFLKMDGAVSRFTLREKEGSCRDCHAQQKGKDFVFRSYLPRTSSPLLTPGEIQIIPSKDK